MAEEEEITNSEQTPSPETETGTSAKGKKKGRFFRKIPKDFLLSPGGVLLVFIAVIFEITDLLIPAGSLTFEIIPDALFAIFLSLIAKVPLTSSILPFLIERIPIISDILPTWLIRMFI